MGQGTAETVREIEHTRERIEDDLRELEDRLPAPALLAKRAGRLAFGGGVSGTLFWMVVRRARKRAKRKRMESAPVRAVVQVVPQRWLDNLEEADWMKTLSRAAKDGKLTAWTKGAAVAWFVLRLAEMRRLRSVERAIRA